MQNLHISLVTGLRNAQAEQSIEINDSIARVQFLKALIADQQKEGTLKEACKWMTKYLENKFVENWPLVQAPLAGLDHPVAAPADGEISLVYRLLTKVVQLLSTKAELALSDLVEELLDGDSESPSRFLKEFDDDDEREKLFQYVFMLLGWLSTFSTSITLSLQGD